MLDLDWHQSVEGQSALAHLRDPVTGAPKKIFGLLERPTVPPSFNPAFFKLSLVGKSGVGKTSLVSYLTGHKDFVGGQQPGETPGVRVTSIYWPAKIRTQLFLFQLDLWDCGEAATKKYNHILPVCKQNASGVVYIFAFTDKSSFDDVEAQLSRRSNSPLCTIVIGTKYGLLTDAQVSQGDVARLESKHNLSVLRVRYHQSGPQRPIGPNPNETALILNLICDQLHTHSTSGAA